MTFPPSAQKKLVLDLATLEGCQAELTWWWLYRKIVYRQRRSPNSEKSGSVMTSTRTCDRKSRCPMSYRGSTLWSSVVVLWFPQTAISTLCQVCGDVISCSPSFLRRSQSLIEQAMMRTSNSAYKLMQAHQLVGGPGTSCKRPVDQLWETWRPAGGRSGDLLVEGLGTSKWEVWGPAGGRPGGQLNWA